MTVGQPLVIACGALAGEIRAGLAGFRSAAKRSPVEAIVEVRYLPAHLHNRPERIVPSIEAILDEAAGRPVFVAYADCGTGGALDAMLARHPGVTRLPGAHCYEVFAGSAEFAELADAEPGTFFLTDFLARHFEALVWQGLGLDRHPELLGTYFGNYRRVVLLSQSDSNDVAVAGRAAAARLGLNFEHRHVGRHRLTTAIQVAVTSRAA